MKDKLKLCSLFLYMLIIIILIFQVIISISQTSLINIPLIASISNKIYFNNKIYLINDIMKIYDSGFGDINLSIQLCKKAISLNKNDYLFYNKLGWIFLENGYYINASEMFNKSISLNPNSFDSYIGVGTILRIEGNYNKSLEYLFFVSTHIPDDPLVYEQISKNYFEMGKFKQAEKAINRSLFLSSSRPSAITQKGNILIKQNKLDKAENILLEFEKEYNQNITKIFNCPYKALGIVYFKKNQSNKSIEYFKKFADVATNRFSAQIGTAFICFNLNDLKCSQYYAKKALEIRPNDNETLELIHKLDKFNS
jgi:tetratricopeptide (TPR) repeat protein